MDVRSRIERLVSSSYSLKRSSSSSVSGSAEYNTFRVTSSLAYDPTKGCFTREALAQLTAFYFNSLLITVHRPILRGGIWDMSARHLCAFGSMNERFDDIESSTTVINNERGVMHTYLPPHAEGLGVLTVNDVPRECSVFGNVLFLRLNVARPEMVLDFEGVFGQCTFRLCRHYWRIMQPADQEAEPVGALRTAVGDITLRASDALAMLSYIPHGGQPQAIQEGATILISQGHLACTGAITGVYQLEFSGMWGMGTTPIIGPWPNNPTSELPTNEEVPEGLREHYLRFMTAATGIAAPNRTHMHGVLEQDHCLRLVTFMKTVLAHW